MGGQQDDALDPAGSDDIEDSVRVLTGNEEFTGTKEEQCPSYAGDGLKALSFRQVGLLPPVSNACLR
jgi:hypothetical protein